MNKNMQIIQKSMLWDVTRRCNLRCSHCYNAEYLSNQKDIDIEMIYQIIVDTFRKLEVNHIHLLGGEPLLEKGIFQLIEYATKQNMIVTINTNGTLLSKEMIGKLIALKVQQITVSLDGVTPGENDQIRGTGVFECVTRNIAQAVETIEQYSSEMTIQVATVITRQNLDNIYRMPALIKSLGIKYLDVLKLYECGNAVANEAKLQIQPEEYINALKRLMIEAYRNNVYLQIDCKPKVLDEINKKYGFCIDLDSNFNKCEAGEKILYMDQTCNIYPCGPMANQLKSSQPNSKLSVSLFDNEVEQKVRGFRKIILGRLERNYDDFCQKCRYISVCSSCALCQGGESRICRVANNF